MSKKDNFITVTQLNENIKSILCDAFSDIIKIKGEISNIKLCSNPNRTFLTLKDNATSINVVSWDTKFENIKNGDDVFVIGKLTCYPKQGTYQITTNKIERIGIGNLHEQYEKDKQLFEKNGYFSKSKKSKNIPTNIKRIGILTSIDGAAIQDFIKELKNNLFYGEIYVKNCFVQGASCPSSICDGISYFNKINKKHKIDILVITRGGGSFEDLIGFSHKDVVKAIHNTNIYTISAVGHEIDTMLSDYASDHRSSTPTMAGSEITTIQKKQKDELTNNLNKILKLKTSIVNKIAMYEEKINSSKNLLNSIEPNRFIDSEFAKLMKIKTALHTKIKTNLDKKNDEITKLINNLDIFDTNKIFKNGYVALVDSSNQLISSVEMYKKAKASKQKLKIIFTDGEVEITK